VERHHRSRSRSREKNRNQNRSRPNDYHRDGNKSFDRERHRSSELFVKRQINRTSIMESGTAKVWARSPEPLSADSDDEQYLKFLERKKQEEQEMTRKKIEEAQKRAMVISSDDEIKHKKSKKSKKKKKKKKRERREDGEEDEEEDQWVESTGDLQTNDVQMITAIKPGLLAPGSIGPEMPEAIQSLYDMDFGKGLMPGEGVAMAEFVANGQRIPRRGEIGMTNDDIQAFERAGYIMSGNRHRRMEAVRLRKESQIYSAEEKRALQLYSKQERDNKEGQVINQFRDMVKQKTLETQRKNEV